MRLGIHALTKAENQFFGNESVERDKIVATWRACGFTDVKLVTYHDEQLNAARYLTEQGFRVLVRFYQLPGVCEVPPTDLMKLFADIGVKVVESVNEPELELGAATPELIDRIAQQHIKFADQCGSLHIMPITPSIQGDRVLSYFEPFINRVIKLGRKDVLEGSYIGCHPRPANNPPTVAPPGFVARSYELFDDVLRGYGLRRPIWATEWGYEPGDADNKEQPRITLLLHATYNVELAQMKWRDCLEVCYYWTWLNDWFSSGWWRGDVAGSLPVVKSFMAMPEPEPPVIPPVVPPPSDVDAALRKAVAEDMAVYPWGIKYAYAHGLIPWGDECGASVGGALWLTQPAYSVSEAKRVLVKFQEGKYTDSETEIVPW